MARAASLGPVRAAALGPVPMAVPCAYRLVEGPRCILLAVAARCGYGSRSGTRAKTVTGLREPGAAPVPEYRSSTQPIAAARFRHAVESIGRSPAPGARCFSLMAHKLGCRNGPLQRSGVCPTIVRPHRGLVSGPCHGVLGSTIPVCGHEASKGCKGTDAKGRAAECRSRLLSPLPIPLSSSRRWGSVSCRDGNGLDAACSRYSVWRWFRPIRTYVVIFMLSSMTLGKTVQKVHAHHHATECAVAPSRIRC